MSAVVQPAADARFLEEHAPPLAVARVLGQQAFDRHSSFESAQSEGHRFHHLRHPPTSDCPDQAIALGRIHGGGC